MKSLLSTILLILAFQISFGQEAPKAVKIDELGATNCCHFAARMDSFFYEIFSFKDSRNAYIIIYSKKAKAEQALWFERLARSHIVLRGFDPAQFSIIKKRSDGDLRIEMWSVEKGANLPFSLEDEGNFVWFDGPKTALFFSSRESGAVCGEAGENKQFARLLMADPTLKGHIVIFESSRRKFLKTKARFLSEINQEYKVPQEQLKIIFMKVENELYPYHELWLVRRKRRS